MPKRPATHPCAAQDCRQMIPRGRLMCRPHWYDLPPALRSAIRSTWAAGEWQAWRANVREAEQLLGTYAR